MWPQITVIVLWSAGIAVNIMMHGKQKGNYNMFAAIFNIALMWFIFDAGGFFNNLK